MGKLPSPTGCAANNNDNNGNRNNATGFAKSRASGKCDFGECERCSLSKIQLYKQDITSC
jgi:hypothetical protein